MYYILYIILVNICGTFASVHRKSSLIAPLPLVHFTDDCYISLVAEIHVSSRKYVDSGNRHHLIGPWQMVKYDLEMYILTSSISSTTHLMATQIFYKLSNNIA